MHASTSFQNNGSRVSKFAIVAALHIGAVAALLQMRIILEKPPLGPTEVVLTTTPVVLPEPTSAIDAPAPTVPPLYVPLPIVHTMTPPQPALTTTNVLPAIDLPVIEGSVITERKDPVVAKPEVKKVFEAATNGTCAVPNYPAASARNGDTGTVGLSLLIAPDGHVADSRVTSSSGFRELDRAAVAALSSCKFKPATTNGVPESAWGKIAYVWTLE